MATIYGAKNQGPGLGQDKTCDGVKPFNEITMNVPSGTSKVAFKRQF